ncbi:helix-turn-helix domain-containing protein [Nitrosomonas ureae]|nr:helix-turn-helix domain-containing protein [Nitrosomonas ureae]
MKNALIQTTNKSAADTANYSLKIKQESVGRGDINMGTHENTVKAQRKRILAYLHTKPLDTLDARKELDVMHPAARVMELRNQGIGIKTIWIDRASDCGKIHRIACYILDGVTDTTPTDTEDSINSKQTDKQEDSTEVGV